MAGPPPNRNSRRPPPKFCRRGISGRASALCQPLLTEVWTGNICGSAKAGPAATALSASAERSKRCIDVLVTVSPDRTPASGALAGKYTWKQRPFGKRITRHGPQHCDADVFLALGFLFGEPGWLTGSQKSVIRSQKSEIRMPGS